MNRSFLRKNTCRIPSGERACQVVTRSNTIAPRSPQRLLTIVRALPRGRRAIAQPLPRAERDRSSDGRGLDCALPGGVEPELSKALGNAVDTQSALSQGPLQEVPRERLAVV